MANGYDYSKEYGPHLYDDQSETSDCRHGCGCSAGGSHSHGPTGLDPLGGECPGNPKSGGFIGGKADYEIVVERRIRALEARARKAEDALKRVSPSKKKLAEELRLANRMITDYQVVVREIRAGINRVLP